MKRLMTKRLRRLASSQPFSWAAQRRSPSLQVLAPGQVAARGRRRTRRLPRDADGQLGSPWNYRAASTGASGGNGHDKFLCEDSGTQPCLVKTISANVVSLVGPVSY